MDVSPRLLFATSAGSLGIIANVDGKSAKILTEIERNMRNVVKGVGNLEQEEYVPSYASFATFCLQATLVHRWRSFKSEVQRIPPAGFVDGNFVELLPTLSKDDLDRVAAGASEHENLSVGIGEAQRLVDELARLH